MDRAQCKNSEEIALEEIRSYDLYSCRIQGELFVLVQDMQYDEADFIKRYMTSRFCNKEMDALYSYFQTADAEDSMDYVQKEFTLVKSDNHYDRNAVFWIGYMYRYLHLRTGFSSEYIYSKIPFCDMLVMYVGMSTQDDEYFLDVIREKLEVNHEKG